MNKTYKKVPDLATESEYAHFWNSVSNATDYLDPKIFKQVEPEKVLSKVPSLSYQVDQVKKLAKKKGLEAHILLYQILKAGIRQFPEFKALL